MASTRKTTEPKKPRRPPATTPDAREKQIIALAVDEVERQIKAGTASSQILTHYVRMSSTRERLEQERLMREVDLLEKKAQGMESVKRVEELYEEAIVAMRQYGGQDPGEHYDD